MRGKLKKDEFSKKSCGESWEFVFFREFGIVLLIFYFISSKCTDKRLISTFIFESVLV